jgi:hypothetical protein
VSFKQAINVTSHTGDVKKKDGFSMSRAGNAEQLGLAAH